MTPKALDLHIDELVLDGLDGLDRAHLGAAVERALGRLLAERGIPDSLTQDARVASLEGGTFDAAPGAPAHAVGAQIAHAVYGGLKR